MVRLAWVFTMAWSLAFGMPGAPVANAQISGGAFAITGSDTVPRYFHAAGMLSDGQVMVSGGLYVNFIPATLVSRNEVSFYDPATGVFTNQFTPTGGGPTVTPTLNIARSSHTQTTLPDGRVLITGGHRDATGTSPGTPFNSVEIFNPLDGSFNVGPSMAIARAMHSATLLTDGRVIIAGGGSWQVFDPVIDSWSANHALARTRTAHAAVLLPDFAGTLGDDRVLLAGGSGTGANTLELLDPNSGGTTLLTAVMATGVDDLAAVRLADGEVFIVGGQNVATGDTISTTYFYDPVADMLTPGPDVPNRPGGIADHALVGFGRYVGVFGGEQEASGTDMELNYAALFDSVTRTWLADGTMLNIHDDLAAVALDACSVLLIDGGVPFFGQEIPAAACEVFKLTIAGGCPTGDLDTDGDVDIEDYAILADCLTGPGSGPVVFDCTPADVDADDDVDLLDFAKWSGLFGE